MCELKEKIFELLDKLTDRQIEYIYHLIVNLFSHTTD